NVASRRRAVLDVTHDAWVADPREDLGLALEPMDIGPVDVADHLDGHRVPRLGIAPAEDPPDASGCGLALDLEPANHAARRSHYASHEGPRLCRAGVWGRLRPHREAAEITLLLSLTSVSSGLSPLVSSFVARSPEAAAASTLPGLIEAGC